MPDSVIYHIAQPAEWQKAALSGLYYPDNFSIEGFIHCSTIDQVAGVLERYYKNQSVLKLSIDVRVLVYVPRYELATSVNQFFPHIYGPINCEAVFAVEPIHA